MPTTDLQREAADRIASEYDEQVRITPGVGHDGLRVAVACPDGRYVLLDQTGGVIVDSRELQGSTLTVVRGGRQVHPETQTARGYDPATDCLIVEACDEEWTVLGPWRCAISAKDHLPPIARDAVLDRVRQWHVNVIGPDAPLVVWEIRAGETDLRRVGG